MLAKLFVKLLALTVEVGNCVACGMPCGMQAEKFTIRIMANINLMVMCFSILKQFNREPKLYKFSFYRFLSICNYATKSIMRYPFSAGERFLLKFHL